MLETRLVFSPVNIFHSHNHQPLALLRQAQEGEEANQQHQEQQEDVGQPPIRRRDKEVCLWRPAGPQIQANPTRFCSLPAAQRSSLVKWCMGSQDTGAPETYPE